jgi:hypothetical protein
VTVNDNPTPIINIPLKLEESELEDDIYALPATSPSSADVKRKFETPTFAHDPSSTTQEFIQNFWEDQDPNAVPMSPTQLLNIFTQTESLVSSLLPRHYAIFTLFLRHFYAIFTLFFTLFLRYFYAISP